MVAIQARVLWDKTVTPSRRLSKGGSNSGYTGHVKVIMVYAPT